MSIYVPQGDIISSHLRTLCWSLCWYPTDQVVAWEWRKWLRDKNGVVYKTRFPFPGRQTDRQTVCILAACQGDWSVHQPPTKIPTSLSIQLWLHFFSWHPTYQGLTWHLRLLTSTLGKRKEWKGGLERKWASASSDSNDTHSTPLMALCEITSIACFILLDHRPGLNFLAVSQCAALDKIEKRASKCARVSKWGRVYIHLPPCLCL